ncbi:hypothetical protein INR76_07745 [Marixanthomonas sp. SCSIO 43207]|nr:hypothetical protein [Marixanthomonas sp. SCSIO 43207]UAB80030.1 hypothetical protein INR76_07745 [Marixanthomonas sp. SCSIO 43207]
MNKEDQNEKHVVGDEMYQKKMEGETHNRNEKESSKNWWEKLKSLFQ